MKCSRCLFEEKYWPIHGWSTEWRKGKFWICPRCLNDLLEWWLELTRTLEQDDPTRMPRRRKGG